MDFDIPTATDNCDTHMLSPVDTYMPRSASPTSDHAPRRVTSNAGAYDHVNNDAMDVDRARIHDSPDVMHPSDTYADRPRTPPLRYTPPRSPRLHATAAFTAAHAHGNHRSNSTGYIDSSRPPLRPRFSGLMGRPRAYSYQGASPSAPPRPPPKVNANNVVGVFGLSIRTTERDLEDEFGRFGEVEKVVIVYDQRASFIRQP